eukprot:scaffold65411_cov32-Tisochrysis_lutea.AAC.1
MAMVTLNACVASGSADFTPSATTDPSGVSSITAESPVGWTPRCGSTGLLRASSIAMASGRCLWRSPILGARMSTIAKRPAPRASTITKREWSMRKIALSARLSSDAASGSTVCAPNPLEAYPPSASARSPPCGWLIRARPLTGGSIASSMRTAPSGIMGRLGLRTSALGSEYCSHPLRDKGRTRKAQPRGQRRFAISIEPPDTLASTVCHARCSPLARSA